MPRLPIQRYLRLVKKIEQGHDASYELEELLQKHLGEEYDDNILAAYGATTFDPSCPGQLPYSFEQALEHYSK